MRYTTEELRQRRRERLARQRGTRPKRAKPASPKPRGGWAKPPRPKYGPPTPMSVRPRRLSNEDRDRTHLLMALGCDRHEAAKLLGVHPDTITYRMKKDGPFKDWTRPPGD